MTIYTRGYRKYEGTLDARGPRWLPIFREGYRQAVKGIGFRVMFGFVVIVTVVLAFMVYLKADVLTEAFLERGMPHFETRQLTAMDHASKNLEGAILIFDMWTSLFVMLLTLFAGSGLIADDLKARALPLYLVRPLTPVDYYVGKFLILVRLLARAVLAPMLALVLLATLLQPSEDMWEFVRRQDRLLLAVLGYFGTLALSYASVALLFSAMTPRRITAIVLGAVAFLGGYVLRAVVTRMDGSLVETLRASSLSGDTGSVLWSIIGRKVPLHTFPPFARPTLAAVAFSIVVLAAAWVVIKRARTVEVVS